MFSYQNICGYLTDLSVSFFLFEGVKPVFFDQWRKIDQVEQERGSKLGKPREKIINVQEMLDIAYRHEGR